MTPSDRVNVTHWLSLAVGLVAVGIGLRGFWLLLHGRSPGFTGAQGGERLGPPGQWFGAALFFAIGIVFVLVGIGIIRSGS